MNKVQKIREEVERLFNHVKDSNFESDSGSFYYLKDLLDFIDSLQEEPISDDLEETAMQYGTDEFPSLCNGCKHVPVDAFKVGAQRQKNQILRNLWHDASEKPHFPCDILFMYPNRNIFLYRFDEKGRTDDGRVYYHLLEEGKWCYLDDILPDSK